MERQRKNIKKKLTSIDTNNKDNVKKDQILVDANNINAEVEQKKIINAKTRSVSCNNVSNSSDASSSGYSCFKKQSFCSVKMEDPLLRSSIEDNDQNQNNTNKTILNSNALFKPNGVNEEYDKLLSSGNYTMHEFDCSENESISSSMLKLDHHLSSDKFQIVWNNLSYTYVDGFFKKQLTPVIKDISGSITSNKLVALVGPSGCGKTTFLSCISGHKTDYQGYLRVKGLKELKAAHIGQDDNLMPGLTVKETLIYSSKLQNRNKDLNHEKHALLILDQVGMLDSQHKLVSQLSGGQIKRVIIAREVLCPKNLLLCDEVTSGLDTQNCLSIIQLLKQLVSDHNYPMTCVVSIHQPSAKIFSLFDQIFVMSEGQFIYEGSPNFDVVNNELKRFSLQCPQYHNICDFLIEIASFDSRSMSLASGNNSYESARSRMVEHCKQSSFNESNLDFFISSSNSETPNSTRKNSFELSYKCEDINELHEAIKTARLRGDRPFFEHTLIHMQRSFRRILRSHVLTYLQLFAYLLLGFLLATFYGRNVGLWSACPRLPVNMVSFIFRAQTEIEDATLCLRRIQENLNFILVSVMTVTFAALEVTVLTFPLEARVVKREWSNGWYTTSSYFMGRTLADLPFQVFFVILFSAIIYIFTGQYEPTSWRFGTFTFCLLLISFISQTVGFVFGALFCDNTAAAVFIAPLCIFPQLLFSGFFCHSSHLPAFYKPMTYVSPYRYAFDSILITIYGFQRCKCDENLLSSYHENKQGQMYGARDLLKTLLGLPDCSTQNINNTSTQHQSSTHTPNDLSISDSSIENVFYNNNVSMLNSTLPALSSSANISNSKMVDEIYSDLEKQMFSNLNSTATTTESSINKSDGLMSDNMTNKLVTLVEYQSNFGRPLPVTCNDYHPYLMNEFELDDKTLYWSIGIMLSIIVFSRIFANILLSFALRRKN